MWSMKRTVTLTLVAVVGSAIAIQVTSNAPGYTLPSVGALQVQHVKAAADQKRLQVAQQHKQATQLTMAIGKIQQQISELKSNYTTHLNQLARQGVIQLSPNN